MMKQTLRCIASLLLLGYIILAVNWSRAAANEARCTRVDIVVNDSLRSRFVTSREIARELNNLPARATTLRVSDIDTDSLERVLDAIDKIESVSCHILSDRSLRIDIDPMQPVARIFDNGKSYYINKDGKRFTAIARYHLDAPLISGHFDSTYMARSLLPLLYYINADSTWSALVTHINAHDRRNIILVPAIRGHVINIGDINDLDSKFDRLRRAYTEILPVKGWNYYDTITVKWGGQIVATRRAKSLKHSISATDFEAEREEPSIDAMLVGDHAGLPSQFSVTPRNTLPITATKNP